MGQSTSIKRQFIDFIKVKEMYDPWGLFSSEWSDQVLGLKGGLVIVKEGCALQGLCICSQDGHFAPRKGFTCFNKTKPSKDAKVCAYLAT